MAAADALDQLAAARAELVAAEQQLLAADLGALSGEQLLELLDVLEVDARRHAAVGCALIAELADRGVAEEAGYTSAVVLLSERLRIGRREAAGRVRLAADLGPRRALTRGTASRPGSPAWPTRWQRELCRPGTPR